jgi:hypothetical protein
MKDFVISNPTRKFVIGTDGAEDNVVLMIADTKNTSIIEMELSEFDMIAIRDHMTARLDEIYENALAEIR